MACSRYGPLPCGREANSGSSIALFVSAIHRPGSTLKVSSARGSGWVTLNGTRTAPGPIGEGRSFSGNHGSPALAHSSGRDRISLTVSTTSCGSVPDARLPFSPARSCSSRPPGAVIGR
jgi:hypothetical protein